MSAGSVEGLQLDRTKAVGKVHGKYRDNQDGDHRYRHERNERPEENEQSSNKFDNDRRPAQQKRGGNADSMQHVDEIVRPAGKSCEPVLHKTEPDNQSKWNGVPRRGNG